MIALIDDASRYIVGIDVFFNDNFVNLMSVMKSAVAKFGVPKLFNFDNGSSYKNKQMDLLAARIGSTVHYDQPYTPTQKAKIERWFRAMKDQRMASLDMRDFHTLDKLRGSLHTYVSQYNQRIHSSLNGKSPQERYFSEPSRFHRLPEDKIDQLFLLELGVAFPLTVWSPSITSSMRSITVLQNSGSNCAILLTWNLSMRLERMARLPRSAF